MLKERSAYLTFRDQNLDLLPLSEIVKLRHERENGFLWSARLATGLFGLPSCPAGNRGPKGVNEVILATGDAGLQFLIKSGFIPCPTCHPEDVPGFVKAAAETIVAAYGSYLHPLSFADKKIVPFDARRVHWERLLPLITAAPDRIYVPSNLTELELSDFKERFEMMGFELPPVGYYDRTAPGHFHQYVIP
ncbi:MAG: hypothetical protein WAV56_04895 [Microgenomates group bacterium]